MTVAAIVWSRMVQVCVLGIGLAAMAIGPAALSASAPPPLSFPSADEAVAALIKAAESNDANKLLAILGLGSERLVKSGDAVADANALKTFLNAYGESHSLAPVNADQTTLVVGQNAWPLPIPIVRHDGRWLFNSIAGAQEIVNRRIGRNELLTIQTLMTAVKAEKDYFDRAERNGSGAYASRILSTSGARDGLYWDVASGEAPSPLGPLVDAAREDGYPGVATANRKPVPLRGYVYRILAAQGPHAPGGAKDYLRDGRLTEGFAFVAWPTEYGRSGIVTFLVDADGQVFQKDLGPATASAVGAMTSFDPDVTWARIDVID